MFLLLPRQTWIDKRSHSCLPSVCKLRDSAAAAAAAKQKTPGTRGALGCKELPKAATVQHNLLTISLIYLQVPHGAACEFHKILGSVTASRRATLCPAAAALAVAAAGAGAATGDGFFVAASAYRRLNAYLHARRCSHLTAVLLGTEHAGTTPVAVSRKVRANWDPPPTHTHRRTGYQTSLCSVLGPD